jgi:hypothetical protein
MLIGDSIRMSYQDRVRKLLEGRATVLGPEENYISANKVHLSPAGVEHCAQRVSAVLLAPSAAPTAGGRP